MSEKRLVPNHTMCEYRHAAYRDAQTRLITILDMNIDKLNLPPHIMGILRDALQKRDAWMNEPLYREG